MTYLTPKVSISIITYNQEKYVSEAIESAVCQDYDNLEVVVSDDGSRDRTPEIIMEYQARYPGRLVAILNQRNCGITANSNRALEACTGEFVCFQGGDDVLLPGKVSPQVTWFQQDSRRVLCGHPVEVFHSDGLTQAHVTKIFSDGAGPKKLIKSGVPYAATSIMVRRAAIPRGGFNEMIRTASDYLFWLEVVGNGGVYGSIPTVYAKQRRHVDNVTNDPLRYIDDLAKTYSVFATRYPRYQNDCEIALTRNYYYYAGALHQRRGENDKARSLLLTALRRDPLMVKAWARLLATVAPRW